MKIIVLFVLFATIQAHSESVSYVCPENNYVYKGITCCLDAVSKDYCEEIVDTQLSEITKKSVETVQRQFKEGLYPFGRVPNCFWSAAVSFQLIGLDENPHFMNYNILWDLLNPIPKASLPSLAGDALVFVAQGEIREDIMENGVPKRAWFPYSSIEHAALALGHDLLFQKENIGTDVFSIDSIENTRITYQKGWNRSPQFRGTMQIEAWRK